MKINRITVWHVDLPFHKTYYLAGGRQKFDGLDSTIIRIDTDEGISGWGEGCPWGNTYLPAFGQGIRAGMELLAPALMGQDPRALWHINHLMDAILPGHPYIKSAIDVACWDILGKFSNLPVYRLLGGEKAEKVAINSSISCGTADDMMTLINEAHQQGYHTHSAKIGGDDVGADIERIRHICTNLPKGDKITFDVNRAWVPAVAISVMNATREMSEAWFEQPCETLEQCQQVRVNTTQPIMLDEVMHNMQDHLNAWKMHACEGVKVKPNRLGGLTKCAQVRDFCVSIGWQMHIEDLGGTALSDTAAFHLASSTPASFRLASWLCHPHIKIDPMQGQGVRNINGYGTPSDAPGLGIEPNPSELGEIFSYYEA